MNLNICEVLPSIVVTILIDAQTFLSPLPDFFFFFFESYDSFSAFQSTIFTKCDMWTQLHSASFSSYLLTCSSDTWKKSGTKYKLYYALCQL